MKVHARRLPCRRLPAPERVLSSPVSALVARLALGLGLGLGAALLSPTDAWAQSRPEALTELSLEDLAQVQVTSVTGRPQSAAIAAASIFVITAEDLRRSTATSLPEALRLAPNLQVSRLNATQWAISARGFNNAIGNKLLVLIDGRTVYSPLFSGVFWDAQAVPLQDVERIEVISGPGATLWGANAVNGVINVITRSTLETPGPAGASGALEGGQGGRQASVSLEGRWSTRGGWRLHALHAERDRTRLDSGGERADDNDITQVGLRADWAGTQDVVTVQAEAYQGGEAGRPNIAPRLSGAHLLGRWRHQNADGTNWQLQAYLDQARRREIVLFDDRTRLADLEFTQVPFASARHTLIWGFGHRRSDSVTERTAFVRFEPRERELRWSSLFVQDEWAALPRLRLTGGLKLERNAYTGTEVLPTVRASFDLTPSQVLWAAWSRAVRAPARLDRDFFFPANPPFAIAGGADFQSEVAKVVEAGWRGQGGRFSGSLTAFHHDYDRLRAGRAAPTRIENLAWGRVWGVEGWGRVELHPHWRLSAGFVELRKSLDRDPASPAVSLPNLGNDPRHQWMLRSSATLARGLELDATVRHVSELPEPRVPGYTAADLRLGWRLLPGLEASLLVQNATDRGHIEYSAAESSRFGRDVWLRLAWRLP